MQITHKDAQFAEMQIELDDGKVVQFHQGSCDSLAIKITDTSNGNAWADLPSSAVERLISWLSDNWS